MKIRAQDTLALPEALDTPEDLDRVLDLSVDSALSISLAKLKDGNSLDSGWYDKIISKLGEVEQESYTLGLASQGIKVDYPLVEKSASDVDIKDIKKRIEKLVDDKGALYKSDYEAVCGGCDQHSMQQVNDWIMASNIPLKQNEPLRETNNTPAVPKSPSTYQDKVREQVKNPNINNYGEFGFEPFQRQYKKSSKIKKKSNLGTSDHAVIEKFLDIQEGEGENLFTDGNALYTHGKGGSLGEDQIVAGWSNDMVVLHSSISKDTKEAQEIIKHLVPEELIIMAKKSNGKKVTYRKGQALDFAMEQNELARAIQAWEPKLTDVGSWIKKVKEAKVWADLKNIWDSLWHKKEETQEKGQTHEFEEFMFEDSGEPSGLELSFSKKDLELRAALAIGDEVELENGKGKVIDWKGANVFVEDSNGRKSWFKYVDLNKEASEEFSWIQDVKYNDKGQMVVKVDKDDKAAEPVTEKELEKVMKDTTMDEEELSIDLDKEAAMTTPTQLAVDLDKVAARLLDLYTEAQKLSSKRKNSQYLLEAVQHLKRGSDLVDKALKALIR